MYYGIYLDLEAKTSTPFGPSWENIDEYNLECKSSLLTLGLSSKYLELILLNL